MKVNLLIDNPRDVRNGYLNIDPYASDTEQDRLRGDLSNISHSVDDAEASEIVAVGVLSYYPGSLVNDIVSGWVKKLAVGGTITISAVDHNQVAHRLHGQHITAEQANELLHGRQEKDWDIIKSSFPIQRLIDVLKAQGLQIVQKRFRDCEAIVTARRPTPTR